MKPDEHYKYNPIEGEIKFFNGSTVYLKDLEQRPSDPEFDSLGSAEYTYSFIDECSQVSEKAFNIVMSRQRFKLDEFKLVPKTFLATNPTKNFAYLRFFKPFEEGTLPNYRAFIPALVQDNPHIPPAYVENLKKLDEVSKQRLLYGNWRYDTDPAKLMEYDAITDIFSNTWVPVGEKYISADIAMMGHDLFVIIVWSGLRGKVVKVVPKSTGKEVEDTLRKVAEEHNVPRSRIVYDYDGLGNYLSSYMNGVREFRGGSTAEDKDTYANMRAECYFKLAELVNQRKIYIDCDDPSIKSKIIQELEQIKADKIDNDETKKRVIRKELIKENIGRSPDFADAVMMRMFFEVTQHKVVFF